MGRKRIYQGYQGAVLLPRSAQQRLVSRVGFTEPVGSALHGCALRLRRPLSGRIRGSVTAIFVLPTAAAAAIVRQLNSLQAGVLWVTWVLFYHNMHVALLRWRKKGPKVPKPAIYAPSSSNTPPLEANNTAICKQGQSAGIPVPCKARKLHHTARFNPELEWTPPPLRRLQIQFDDALSGPFTASDKLVFIVTGLCPALLLGLPLFARSTVDSLLNTQLLGFPSSASASATKAWKMSFYWKLFLTVVIGFYILSLTSLATGFDVSPDKKCLLRVSAFFYPSLNPWKAIGLLAVLATLFTSWTAVRKSLVEPVFGIDKVVSFFDIFGRIVAITLRNVFFTALHFIWWRPVASVLCIGFGVIFNAQIQNGWDGYINLSWWQMGFAFLFVFKFLKVVVHSISYLTYRPQLPSAKNAAYNTKDVTVIIPSIDNFGAAFARCIQSVIQCKPAHVFVATVESKKDSAERACREVSKDIRVITVKEANKRAQFLEAVSFVTTKIIISADDQVYWGGKFLRYALAPFNDVHVGLVGIVKRVDRENLPLFSFRDILNYIAVMYLERSNFELTATSNIEGGVSTISGRTVLMRTDMVKNPNFAHEYLNETWLFGMRGPLLVDDDKFLTR
ncbi:hypothetical protein V502_09085 [Pseudogymnoascus sp. VKM F-4520 (FW-2644)]|nr:hypothetical protein V502_09085 [Pseudogymnoascus sp. VKM F-4520 (FW-2644)]